MNAPASRLCIGCGKDIIKAHRIEGERCFCATCYQRVFKHRLCSGCGMRCRLPKDDPAAICRACIKKLPCARCAKTGYRLGKFTSYGPVCNSCSRYFRVSQPPATDAAHVLKGASVKPSASERGTCQECRRHRRLSAASNGRKLCSLCLTLGQVPCPCCGNMMPAGRGNACDSCYWKTTFNKRLRLDAEGLSSQRFASLFRSFGMWLLDHVPPQKAALSIHRYFAFFREMEEHWRDLPAYPQLLDHFTAEGLRRVRLPMQWLSGAGLMTVSSDEREHASELRRIEAIVSSVPSGTAAAARLSAYRDELLEKAETGRTSIRSVRLALRPAASLLLDADPGGVRLPHQAALDRYLLAVPGQQAAVTGFVLFLNRRYGTTLVSRTDVQRTRSLRRKKLEAELSSLLGSDGRDAKFKAHWIVVSLQYFHGLPRSVSRGLGDTAVSPAKHGFSVKLNGASYWVPHWDYCPSEGDANPSADSAAASASD